MRTKRELAQQAARLGFDVFPILPNAKQPPLIKHWPNLATRDPEQIDAWWDEWPEANIGGSLRDKLAFDVDKRNGGWDTWGALRAIEHFPNTLCSTTAGGGAHIIYQMPEGQKVTNGAHKAGQGVDIKGFGGYIVLPGSTINGKKYEWDNNTPVAFAPEWAIERYKNTKERTAAAGKRIVEEDDIAIELFKTYIQKHAPRAELGKIDDTTFEVAARGYDYGCSETTVLELVSEWNETHCDGLGNLERLPVVVNSAGTNRDNPIGCAHPLAGGFAAVDIDESKAPAAPKPTEGMKLERYFAAAAKALSAQAEPLIKGVLDRGAMSILYGESNTGKTFIAVDMAFHIAAALAWAKCKVRGGAVVYVAAEGGAGVYKRLAALREHYPAVGDIPLFIIKFPVDLLHSKEHAAALVKLCRQAADEAGQGLELVVIDTVSRALSGGDENSSTDMGAMVKSFDAIREATSAHLMGIHHSGKDRARGARGHSLLRAATDTEIEVERGKLAVTKQRDMDGEFKQGFSLRTVPIGLDADGGVVTSCVVELTAPGAAGQVVVPLTKTQATIVKALKAWLGEDDKHRSFGWKDARTAISDADSDAAVGASTLKEHLKAISDAGHSRKLSENTYVFD